MRGTRGSKVARWSVRTILGKREGDSQRSTSGQVELKRPITRSVQKL